MAIRKHSASQRDDQGVLVDSPAIRKQIVVAAKVLKRIGEDREGLSAEKRSVLENLVADGKARKAIERAVKDVEMDCEKLERQDFWYTMARAALGKPLQGQLFPNDTTH